MQNSGLGNAVSPLTESFGADGLLEEPHYTRPADWRGWSVPEVLRSGDHVIVSRDVWEAGVRALSREATSRG